ncbi:MAG: hypothetical protein ACLTXH_07130 [Enterobacter hormaechei]
MSLQNLTLSRLEFIGAPTPLSICRDFLTIWGAIFSLSVTM